MKFTRIRPRRRDKIDGMFDQIWAQLSASRVIIEIGVFAYIVNLRHFGRVNLQQLWFARDQVYRLCSNILGGIVITPIRRSKPTILPMDIMWGLGRGAKFYATDPPKKRKFYNTGPNFTVNLQFVKLRAVTTPHLTSPLFFLLYHIIKPMAIARGGLFVVVAASRGQFPSLFQPNRPVKGRLPRAWRHHYSSCFSLLTRPRLSTTSTTVRSITVSTVQSIATTAMDTQTRQHYLADAPPSVVRLEIREHFDKLTDGRLRRYAHFMNR